MPTRRHARRYAALVVAAVPLAACGPHSASTAGANPAGYVALSEGAWRPPSGQRCVAAPLPASLPSVAQIVDTGAVDAILVAQPVPDGAYALLSLKFDTAGEVARAVVIEGSLADADRNRVALAVANALRTQPHAGAPWGVRLRVDGTTPPLLRVGRAEWCDAAPSSWPTTVSGAGQAERMERNGPGEPEGVHAVTEPARWRVVVDADGKVASAALLTATHRPELARETQERVMRLRFHPALDDRMPVAVVDTIDYAISGVGR